MNQQVDQFAAGDAPARVYDEQIYPKLSIKNTAILCKEFQQSQGSRLKSLALEEKGMTSEARVRFLALTLAGDFGLSHLWDWSMTAEGSRRIVKVSLIQGGMTSEAADQAIEKLTGKFCQDTAMEIVDHENSPSNILRRQAEWEAREAAKAQGQNQEGNKKPDPQ